MAIKKKRSVKKLILIILLCVIILLTAGWGLFCVSIYNENFNVRGDSYEPLMLRLEDFSGLECREYSFPAQFPKINRIRLCQPLQYR